MGKRCLDLDEQRRLLSFRLLPSPLSSTCATISTWQEIRRINVQPSLLTASVDQPPAKLHGTPRSRWPMRDSIMTAEARRQPSVKADRDHNDKVALERQRGAGVTLGVA